MLRIYVPVAVTMVLLVSLTIVEAQFSDRWTDSSISAEEFGKRFANLPMEVGAWVGTDEEVKDETLEVAGAVNHVSRYYLNDSTNERVDIWLVVGHARDIGRHTPDVCYPSQGFAQDGDKLKQHIEASGEEPATFFTARFRSESNPGRPTRVFWAWHANQTPEDQWEAPDNTRLAFGNNTALYKLYFTSNMSDKNQPITENIGYEFAKIMLPVINRTLFPERYGIAPGDVAKEVATAAREAEAQAAEEPAPMDAVDPAAATSDPAAAAPVAAPAN